MGEIGAGEAGAAGGHDTAQLYVKKYYLIVAASVFFFNGTIKYVTSRSQGKLIEKGEYQKNEKPRPTPST